MPNIYATDMKTLKFRGHLVEKILRGEKDATWRLFDDKDLTEGDVIEFINSDTGEPFGTAVIEEVTTRTLGTIEESDWVGHERFPSDEAMYETYRSYYGDRVGPDTEVKILKFKFVAG